MSGPDDPPVHAVTLEWTDGRAERLRVAADETVLGAADRAGLGLPFGCLTGACATCTAELLAGEVTHRRPPRALKDDQLAAGYVLLCIAEPRGDCRLRVGTDIHSGLYNDPWR